MEVDVIVYTLQDKGSVSLLIISRLLQMQDDEYILFHIFLFLIHRR